MRPRATTTLRESLATAASASRHAIGESNVGFQLLQKAGWRPGTGLGANEEGPTAPVPQFQKTDRRGLGAETPKSLTMVGERGAPKEPGEKRKRRARCCGRRKTIGRRALATLYQFRVSGLMDLAAKCALCHLNESQSGR